jgi:hypothetical protein
LKILKNIDGDIGFEGLDQEDFQTVLRAAGETETTQENIHDWLYLDKGDPGFQLMTDLEIAADVMDSAIEEESDNELDELQEYKIEKKHLSSSKDGIDAAVNYVDSLTNQKLPECDEHLGTMMESLIIEQQQRFVQTKFDTFFKPPLLCSKTNATSEFSVDE